MNVPRARRFPYRPFRRKAITYSLKIPPPDPGRIIELIRQYEQRNGAGWRGGDMSSSAGAGGPPAASSAGGAGAAARS